jgi:hypothetical protein
MKMIRDDNTNIEAKQNNKLQISTRLTNKYHDANTVTGTNVSPVSDPFAAHNLNIFSRNSLGYSRNILRAAIYLSIYLSHEMSPQLVYILVLPKVLGLSVLRADEQSMTRFK